MPLQPWSRGGGSRGWMGGSFDSPIPTPVSAGPKPSVRLHFSVCAVRPVARVCPQGHCRRFGWDSFCPVRKGSTPCSCSLNGSSSSLWQPDCPVHFQLLPGAWGTTLGGGLPGRVWPSWTVDPLGVGWRVQERRTAEQRLALAGLALGKGCSYTGFRWSPAVKGTDERFSYITSHCSLPLCVHSVTCNPFILLYSFLTIKVMCAIYTCIERYVQWYSLQQY